MNDSNKDKNNTLSEKTQNHLLLTRITYDPLFGIHRLRMQYLLGECFCVFSIRSIRLLSLVNAIILLFIALTLQLNANHGDCPLCG